MTFVEAQGSPVDVEVAVLTEHAPPQREADWRIGGEEEEEELRDRPGRGRVRDGRWRWSWKTWIGGLLRGSQSDPWSVTTTRATTATETATPGDDDDSSHSRAVAAAPHGVPTRSRCHGHGGYGDSGRRPSDSGNCGNDIPSSSSSTTTTNTTFSSYFLSRDHSDRGPASRGAIRLPTTPSELEAAAAAAPAAPAPASASPSGQGQGHGRAGRRKITALSRVCRARPTRATMFLLVTLFLLLGGYVHYLWRAEAALSAPWVADPASRLFAQRPLLGPAAGTGIESYELPLRTRGRDIVDQRGRRFKLASVNWYGASDELFVPGGLDVRHRDAIAATIRGMGFNSVRLPYADELVTANPEVEARLVAANPDLAGLRAVDVLEACVTALTGAGLAVIVNNHITQATWCCGADPCDAGWANDHLGPLCRVRQTEEDWIRHWELVMARFRGNPRVIGADLRNEVRGVWGTMPWDRWASAAERAGNRLLRLNPDLLIVVGGTESGNDLRGAGARPVSLDLPDRVVYSAHVYAWSGWGSLEGRYSRRGYASFVRAMRDNWGYLVEGGAAPVWVGEFGAPERPSMGAANYWQNLVRYLKVVDADFGYWAVNPRKPRGNETETYALVRDDWETPVLDYRMKDLTEMMRAPQEGWVFAGGGKQQKQQKQQKVMEAVGGGGDDD